MSRQRGVLGAVLAIVLANTGCVACCHKSHQRAWEHGADCDLPTACRGQVYVFLIHGLTPTTDCGLEALRLKLAENGFPKVGVAELGSNCCVASEVKKIRQCEPDARFVLVGYDLGGPAAVRLARDLTMQGARVEGAVLLDPTRCVERCGGRTLLITSGTTPSTAPHTDRIVVPDATHFKLPAHPATVAAVTEFLKEVAARGYEEGGEPVPAWSYKHAPEMRHTASGAGRADWNFLADHAGTPAAIDTRVVSEVAYPTVPTAPSTSAGPVVLTK